MAAHKEKKTQANVPARMRFATNKFGSPVVTVFGRGYSLEDSSVRHFLRLGGSLAPRGKLTGAWSMSMGGQALRTWDFTSIIWPSG